MSRVEEGEREAVARVVVAVIAVGTGLERMVAAVLAPLTSKPASRAGTQVQIIQPHSTGH